MLFFLAFSLNAQVRDFRDVKIEETGKQISENFVEGSYLIYDCDKLFYACVSSSGFEFCQARRKLSEFERRPSLSCAPLAKFDSIKNCQKKQIQMVSHPKSPVAICKNK